MLQGPKQHGQFKEMQTVSPHRSPTLPGSPDTTPQDKEDRKPSAPYSLTPQRAGPLLQPARGGPFPPSWSTATRRRPPETASQRLSARPPSLVFCFLCGIYHHLKLHNLLIGLYLLIPFPAHEVALIQEGMGLACSVYHWILDSAWHKEGTQIDICWMNEYCFTLPDI